MRRVGKSLSCNSGCTHLQLHDFVALPIFRSLCVIRAFSVVTCDGLWAGVLGITAFNQMYRRDTLNAKVTLSVVKVYKV